MQNPKWPFFLDLKKPLGNGIRSLRIIDPNLPDLAGLLTGEKPVLYTDYSPQDWNYIKDLCEKLKLKYLHPEELYRKTGFHADGGNSGRKMLLIGKEPRKLSLAAKCWNDSATNIEWGVLLGYPECCVKAYVKWRMELSREHELINLTFDNSPRKGPYYFGLNNVFNLFSRISAGETGKSGRLSDLNKEKNIFISALHIASWHPCSYACPRSLKKAVKVYDFLRTYAPGYAGMLKALLARPVLFFGKFEFAVFNGQVKDGLLSYRGLEAPVSLLKTGLSEKLRRGDAARVNAGSLVIKKGKGRETVVPFKKPPILLNFSA